MGFNDVISICVLVITVIAAIVSLLLTFEYMRKNRTKRYDEREKIAIIDDYRRHYEEMIYKLQSELMENQRRWQDVNHLIINGQNSTDVDLSKEKKLLSSSFFENLGINLSDTFVESKSVFVLTPFSEKEALTFQAIKTVCGEIDLKCSRGDEVYRENNILSHVVESILKANIIVANINGRNPNVFYELGICHAIGKPVIVISKTKNALPFDISAKNIIFYTTETDLQEQLKNEFLKIFINSAT